VPHVSGLREAVKKLEELTLEVDDLKDVMAKIAALATEAAAKYAPSRSGKLRASIRGNRAKGKAVVTAGRATVRYAGAINYGYPRRHIKAAGFMQAADKEIGPQALDLYEQGINDVIVKKGLS